MCLATCIKFRVSLKHLRLAVKLIIQLCIRDKHSSAISFFYTKSCDLGVRAQVLRRAGSRTTGTLLWLVRYFSHSMNSSALVSCGLAVVFGLWSWFCKFGINNLQPLLHDLIYPDEASITTWNWHMLAVFTSPTLGSRAFKNTVLLALYATTNIVRKISGRVLWTFDFGGML